QLAPEQRRLADEEVYVPGQLGEALARAGVPRIGERVRRVPEAKAERPQLVVRQPDRRHLEARGPERDVLLVLAELERPLEHPRRPHPLAELGELLDPRRLQPEL